MIDYIYEGPGVLKKKVVAEEIRDVQTLKNKYIAKSGGREDGTVLRVFHVQNWPRLTHFLIQKFRLHDNGDALTGQSGFVDWVTQKKPQRRAGKPLLMGKTWKVSTDPWRREYASKKSTAIVSLLTNMYFSRFKMRSRSRHHEVLPVR